MKAGVNNPGLMYLKAGQALQLYNVTMVYSKVVASGAPPGAARQPDRQPVGRPRCHPHLRALLVPLGGSEHRPVPMEREHLRTAVEDLQLELTLLAEAVAEERRVVQDTRRLLAAQ